MTTKNETYWIKDEDKDLFYGPYPTFKNAREAIQTAGGNKDRVRFLYYKNSFLKSPGLGIPAEVFRDVAEFNQN